MSGIQIGQLQDRRLSLRPIRAGDRPFLRRVYAETRAEELALVDWSEAQKESFLRMQFDAQHTYYQKHYPGAHFLVILRDGEPIGRLYLVRWPDEIRIIDIALCSSRRNQGTGSTLLRRILDQARDAGVPVTIHVEQFNPAMRLYRRLGFRPIGEFGVYRLMEWRPNHKQDVP